LITSSTNAVRSLDGWASSSSACMQSSAEVRSDAITQLLVLLITRRKEGQAGRDLWLRAATPLQPEHVIGDPLEQSIRLAKSSPARHIPRPPSSSFTPPTTARPACWRDFAPTSITLTPSSVSIRTIPPQSNYIKPSAAL
jgi:hypothetical protein